MARAYDRRYEYDEPVAVEELEAEIPDCPTEPAGGDAA